MEKPVLNGVARIRPATTEDVPVLLRLIRELAEFEHLAHLVTATEEGLRQELFGKQRAEAVLALLADEPVGFALYFHNFSTFLGRSGIWLEDLYVCPEARGRGIGKALLLHVADIARTRRCGRFEWAVLDWNEHAIRVYRRLGAEPLDDWTIMRVTGAALERVPDDKKPA